VWQNGKTLDANRARDDIRRCYEEKVFCQGGVFFGNMAKHYSRRATAEARAHTG
jgi:hypothetical protein